jgi:hypothetical protein
LLAFWIQRYYDDDSKLWKQIVDHKYSPSVTSRVTKNLIKLLKLHLSLKARANQTTKTWYQIQSERLKISNCQNCAEIVVLMAHNFWKFIEVGFGHDPKR